MNIVETEITELNAAELAILLKKLDAEYDSLKNSPSDMTERLANDDRMEQIKSKSREIIAAAKQAAAKREHSKKERIKTATIQKDEITAKLTDEMLLFADNMKAVLPLSTQFNKIIELSKELAMLGEVSNTLIPFPLSPHIQRKRLFGALISSFGSEVLNVSKAEAANWIGFDLKTDIRDAVNSIKAKQ